METKICHVCNGNKVLVSVCPKCNGSGQTAAEVCQVCSGKKFLVSVCPNCNGLGQIAADIQNPRKIRPTNIQDANTIHRVHRNEQVNIVALSRGIQTVLCSGFISGEYYILTPSKLGAEHGRFKFDLSNKGRQMQNEIQHEYGYNLERFPRKFIASQYATYDKPKNNSKEFWAEMDKAGLFTFWDPEGGPKKFFDKKKRGSIQILRVYKVCKDLSNHCDITEPWHVPIYVGSQEPLEVLRAEPIWTEDEMREEKRKLEDVLRRFGNI